MTAEQLIDRSERELCGQVYGELGLAVNFTDGIRGDSAKENTRGWKQTEPLPHPARGIALLTSRLDRNPIVVLGASRLIGIDVDGEPGRALLRAIEAEFPRTVTVVSGRDDGGHHLWYRPPAGAPPGVVKVQLKDKVIASKDGYLCCPPARHPSGRTYRFAEGREPWTIAIVELPLPTVELAGEHGLDRAGGQPADRDRPGPSRQPARTPPRDLLGDAALLRCVTGGDHCGAARRERGSVPAAEGRAARARPGRVHVPACSPNRRRR